MKQLVFRDQEFHAEQIVKTQDSIIGYISNDIVFEFRGISDFSAFKLSDGQEWDIPQPTGKDRIAELEKIINMILMGEL